MPNNIGNGLNWACSASLQGYQLIWRNSFSKIQYSLAWLFVFMINCLAALRRSLHNRTATEICIVYRFSDSLSHSD